jgi:hypothetical protein
MAYDNYFWYPDTPPVFEGGRQPYEGRKRGSPAQLSVDNPPGLGTNILVVPTPNPRLPGQLRRTLLNPSLLNNPPVTFTPSPKLWLTTVLGSWQFPDPLPTLPQKLTPPSVDLPPFGQAGIQFYNTDRRLLPQTAPKFPQGVTTPAVNNPPPYRVGIQFYGSDRRLLPPTAPKFPFSAAAQVDNPPGYLTDLAVNYYDWPLPQTSPKFPQGAVVPTNPYQRYWLSGVVQAWQPPDTLPTLPVKLTPPSVDLPPFTYNARESWYPPVLTSWQPPDPLPTLPGKLTPPSVDNPPRLSRQPLPTQPEPGSYQQARPLFPQTTVAAQVTYAPGWLLTVLNAWQPQDQPLVQRAKPFILGQSVDNPPQFRAQQPYPLPDVPLPTLARYVPQVTATAVQNPYTNYWLSGIIQSWQPIDLPPTLQRKLNPFYLAVTVSNPPPLIRQLLPYPQLPPYQFRQLQLNPSLLNNPPSADNPPFAEIVLLTEPWLEDQYRLPTLPRKLVPTSTTVTVNNPPPYRVGIQFHEGVRRLPVQLSRINLNPSLLNNPPSVDNPPFGLLVTVIEPWVELPPYQQRRSKVTTSGVVQTDNPPGYLSDIQVVYQDISLPTQLSRINLNPSLLNNPPTFVPYTNVTQRVILSAWQPEQSYQFRQLQLNPHLLDVEVNNPPFGILEAAFDPWVETPLPYQRINYVVQPGPAEVDNPPGLLTNIINYDLDRPLRLPQLPRQLNPSILSVPANNPPFSHMGRWVQSVTIRSSWEPPDPQAPGPGKLNPFFLAVAVNNPPFSYPGRNPALNPIIATWQPPDPQPTQRGPLSPFFTAVPVNNPPFSNMGRWVQTITIGSSWQPPLPMPVQRIPGNPGSGPTPPVTVGQFTVSGQDVSDRFPVYDVSYTYAPITKRTN